MSVNINLETITPDVARHLLSKNISNRSLRPMKVDEYTRQMRSGDWQITHQGIAINKHGQLIDGQHRLTAVVRSGVTVQMFVARGFDAEDHRGLMVDTGIKRTVADVYGIDSKASQVCAFLARVGTKNNRCTYEEIKSFIDEFANDVSAILKVTTKHVPIITSSPVIAAAVVARRAAMAEGKDGQYVLDAYERLRSFDTSRFTSSESAFAKAIMRGDIRSTDKSGLFAKGLVVFDEDSQGVTRIISSTQRVDAAVKLINRTMEQRKDGHD